MKPVTEHPPRRVYNGGARHSFDPQVQKPRGGHAGGARPAQSACKNPRAAPVHMYWVCIDSFTTSTL